MSWASRFAAYWAALDVAHDVADHLVQTDHQAAGKAAEQGWRGPMAGHVGSYTATQLVALGALYTAGGPATSRRRLLAAVALSAGTHALLDRRWPVRLLLRVTGSPRFALAEFVVRDTFHAAALRHRGADQADAVVAAATHPVPLHGVYLADQAAHRAILLVCAAILAGRR